MYEHEKIINKIFVGTLNMILKVFLRKKIFGEISVEYVGDLFSNAMN
jgi:hypothetical protein